MLQLVRCATRARSYKHFVLALAIALCASAESLILDCVGDGYSSGAAVTTATRELRLPGMALFAFRTWNIAGWRVDGATMFLHVAKGEPPAKVEIATFPDSWREAEPPRLDPAKLKFALHDVSVEPQNWVTIQVQPALMQELAGGKAHGLVVRSKGKEWVVHARESASFAPKLFVAGGRR